MKVLHIPCSSDADVRPVIEKGLEQLRGCGVVGLVATAQHLHQLDAAREFLEEKGIRAVIGGQILGCQQEPALEILGEVGCFVYLGSGHFHPTAVALETEKPVYVANPLSNAFEEISGGEKDEWRKKQKARLGRAAGAEVWGILVSTKSGQFHVGEAVALKGKLEQAGKKAFLFAGDELSPQNLLPFKVDAWVNTACPRLVDDEYEKPVLNAEELEELL